MFFLKLILCLIKIYLIQSKCVMYDTCSNQSQIYLNSNPVESKWYNCIGNLMDPVELNEQHETDLFKELCPMLAEQNDESKNEVCCSYNQLLILKNDLQTAASVIGSCASCYHNFRTLWCNLACNPLQHEFLVPVVTKKMKYYDFQTMYDDYLSEKDKIHDNSSDGNDITENDDYENYDYTNYNDDYNEDNNHHIEKRQVKQDKTVVTKINYYVNNDFITNLIESCR